jgi:predicted nucleic acid-binding protein
VDLPKAYLESSVISYLAARPSRDILATAHQHVTREWWERRRSNFDLYISLEVLNEIRRGNSAAAELRLRYVQSLPVLEADDQARALAAEILRASALPQKAAADAAHIGSPRSTGWSFS